MTLIANLRHAARNHETVTIGGGDFGPAELNEAARVLELHSALLHTVYTVLPYIEDAEQDPAYKPGSVAKITEQVRTTIAKATGETA